MNRSRSILTPAVLLVSTLIAAFVVPGDSLAFHVDAKTKLSKTFTSKVVMATERVTISIDGEDMSSEFQAPAIVLTDEVSLKISDEYATLADGRPTKFTRTYDDLTGSEIEKVTPPPEMGGDEQETKKKKSSPLDGKSVVFTWDPKKESWTREWKEGEKGDDDLLGELESDMDLLGVVHPKPVSTGDEWDIAPKVFYEITNPGRDLKLKSEPGAIDEEGSSEDDGDNELIESTIAKNVEGSAKATYKGTRDVDGKKYGVIALKSALTAKGSYELKDHKSDVDTDMKFEGEVLWDIQGGHFHSLKLTGTIELTLVIEGTFNDGTEHTVKQELHFKGELENEAKAGT